MARQDGGPRSLHQHHRPARYGRSPRPGVTGHYARIVVDNLPVGDDSSFKALTDAITLSVDEAVKSVLTCFGARRIAFLSPLFPQRQPPGPQLFTESGFTVARELCFECASPVAIAQVPVR